MSGGSEGTGVEETPTYSVALVAFFLILISLLVERGIHRLKKYLKQRNQRPLRKVVDKMTEELMLLGFISLLVTALQSSLIKICVTPNFAKHMLPCSTTESTDRASAPAESHVATFGRKLLNYYYLTVDPWDMQPKRRLMAEGKATGRCASKGKVPFVSQEVLHQLHMFIFVLAITHVCYSLITVLLGFARLHNWRHWEEETRKDGYDGNEDLRTSYCKKIQCEKPPVVGISGHAKAFVDKRANHWCYENRLSLWMLCFFQQFVASISREDYLTFRVGFLNKHNLGESFNFRDYVIRSMEVDFKKVIGISWWLWLFVILFLLLNVSGWYTYFWAAFIPTILVVIIGTKQQHIISTLALQAKRHAANTLAEEANAKAPRSTSKPVDVAKAVSPDNKLFWFDNPQILLKLIHFIIFQNSFELAIFFWLLTTFGWKSCVLGNHTLLIIRVVTGICTQLLASYSTLPIYALVTQMGSTMKGTVFTKDVFNGITAWQNKAKRNKGKRSSSSSVENSQHLGENGSSTGGAQGGSTEGNGVGKSTLWQIATLPREGAADMDKSQDPDARLAKKCQLMYGKQGGLQRLQTAARVNSFRPQ